MKSKGATAKKVEKRIDNTHKRVYKENYEGVKNVDTLKGKKEYVCYELRKFAHKRGGTPSGHGIASPSHNRVDSIRDESVFNSINTDQAAWTTVSGTQTRTQSRDSKFRESLQDGRTFGGTSV